MHVLDQLEILEVHIKEALLACEAAQGYHLEASERSPEQASAADAAQHLVDAGKALTGLRSAFEKKEH